MIISLDDIAEELECYMDGTTAYLDTQTGEVEWFSDYNSEYLGNNEDFKAWWNEEYEGPDDRFVRMPRRWEINDYHIMEDFIESLPDEKAADSLARAIEGRGAFGRFRAVVDSLGKLDEWYAFKHDAYVQITREWCEENEVKYKEETKKKKR